MEHGFFQSKGPRGVYRPGVLPEADWSCFGRATSIVRLKRCVRLASKILPFNSSGGLSASSPALHKPAPLSFSRSFYRCSEMSWGLLAHVLPQPWCSPALSVFASLVRCAHPGRVHSSQVALCVHRTPSDHLVSRKCLQTFPE